MPYRPCHIQLFSKQHELCALIFPFYRHFRKQITKSSIQVNYSTISFDTLELSMAFFPPFIMAQFSAHRRHPRHVS